MKKILIVTALTCSVLPGAWADAQKWDPRMAQNAAVIDTNGVKWIDGKFLPIEGRAFNDTAQYYDRLPANVTTNVNGGVRSMKCHTSGMLFRFKTDARKLRFRWVPTSPALAMDHMPASGMSGIDIYTRPGKGAKWQYKTTGRIYKPAYGERVIDFKPGEECLVNLPLYNGIKSFTLGIETNATISAAAPHVLAKPVVFYGTSITHGGCASRPGLAFVNRVGRDLDIPVVGLGFSGSGVMEFEMSEHIARIDASCYVLDCLWNMSSDPTARNGRSVERNFEPFVRNLRAKRPGVPIIFAEQCDVWCGAPNEKDVFMKKLFAKLQQEGWKNIYYLPKDKMYSGDTEGTVDGCHPNDIGMASMAAAFGGAIRIALGL